MKYILLCALLISGAFFSMAGHTQEQPNRCPDGGTFQNHPQYGEICSVPMPSGMVYVAEYAQRNVKAEASTKKRALDLAGAQLASTYNSTVTSTSPDGLQITTHTTAGSFLSSNEAQNRVTINISNTYSTQCHPSMSVCNKPADSNFDAEFNMSISTKNSEYCPPDNEPKLTTPGGESPNKICFVPAYLEPCDCSELAGEGTLPYTSFIAQKGVYSVTNPPQCNTVTDPDTGGQCHCQLVAQKWLQTTHTNNGVEYDRWSPLPYDKDKPSGTYTGVACGDEDADTAPPEKEECFTLKSGVKWCFANPDEKCTVVNGQEQCSTGCGYVNGDFVCYEDKDPVIPDRPNEDMEEIDDTITDPDKTMPDINKGDLKEIQAGTEQRLDNVIIGVNNNNNQLQNIGDKIGQTNSKLDGIGQQLDGQGKSLKGIADGIEDAFGDDGAPDGKCEGECTGSWYESAYPDGIVGIWEEHKQAFDQTPAFQFLNQFKVTPSGSQPDWSLCFNLGPMGDFGCETIAVPDFVWNFIKICILITAAFLCRALIFGG